jgi:hypothetical protein
MTSNRQFSGHVGELRAVPSLVTLPSLEGAYLPRNYASMNPKIQTLYHESIGKRGPRVHPVLYYCGVGTYSLDLYPLALMPGFSIEISTSTHCCWTSYHFCRTFHHYGIWSLWQGDNMGEFSSVRWTLPPYFYQTSHLRSVIILLERLVWYLTSR